MNNPELNHPDAAQTFVMRSGELRAGRWQTPQWLLVVLLAVIATTLVVRNEGSATTALAQNQPLAGARGLFAFTGQLDSNAYGLFMLDVDQGTVWCYEIDTVGGTRKLRLIAARTWVYDRYLQDFNCAQPDFRAVQQLVSEQRAVGAASRGGADAEPERPEPANRRP